MALTGAFIEGETNVAFNYLAEANLTLSNKFHGDKVTIAELRHAMAEAIKTGERIDRIKKALFYGRGDDIGLTHSPGAVLATEAPYLIMGVDNVAEIIAPEQDLVSDGETLLHAALGKFTEAAEFLEGVFKALNGESPPDVTNLLEEIGDGFWYDAIALAVLGSDFHTEQRRNINKLRLRFPNNFSEYDANNRDLFAERATLEADVGSHYAFSQKRSAPAIANPAPVGSDMLVGVDCDITGKELCAMCGSSDHLALVGVECAVVRLPNGEVE